MARIGIAPIETSISVALSREAERNRGELELTSGFDYEYMRVQVRMHTEAMVLVETLSDRAPYIEVKRFLEGRVDIMGHHRNEAALILRQL